MHARRRCLAIASVLLGLTSGQWVAAEQTISERIAHTLNPQYRTAAHRLQGIDKELSGLPELLPAPFASRYGFRSEILINPKEPDWLQLDLRGSRQVDRIVIAPVFAPDMGKKGAGYGFPRRFKVEISNHADMKDSITVVDCTLSNLPNPGRFPLDFSIEPVTCRYVRMTSTLHYPVESGFIWAIEELMALSGNQTGTVQTTVTSSNEFSRYPNWSGLRSMDGQSCLGMPVNTTPSPSRGFLSEISMDPDERMQLAIDFGQLHEIDEIRLLPIQKTGFEIIPSHAFPRSYFIELATDPEFKNVVWKYTKPTHNQLGYPGNCAFCISADGVSARYMRMVSLQLWGDQDGYGYGLAEIQAYSGNDNVAMGKDPLVSGQRLLGATWSPSFLTDGFTSLHQLIEFPDYLDLIARRKGLSEERNQLITDKAKSLKTTRYALAGLGITAGTLTIIGVAWLLIRQSALRRRSIAQLRSQIARDLHDDIGTNLGGILLMSEIGSRQSEHQHERKNFHTIHETAKQTTQSMQDIVWLIEHDNLSLTTMISRMREVTELILGNISVSLAIEPEVYRDRELSLFFRRHFLFAFKEALNNIRRHAAAKSVDIRIQIESRSIGFDIKDDGQGFEMSNQRPGGHGLSNFKRRAERLDGECKIESKPGSGTRITFQGKTNAQP